MASTTTVNDDDEKENVRSNNYNDNHGENLTLSTDDNCPKHNQDSRIATPDDTNIEESSSQKNDDRKSNNAVKSRPLYYLKKGDANDDKPEYVCIESSQDYNGNDGETVHRLIDPQLNDNSTVTEYACLLENTALSSVFILDNVLLPLLQKQNRPSKQQQQQQQQGKDYYNLRSSLHLTYAKKFVSRVCRHVEQAKMGVKLAIPNEIEDESVTIDDIVKDNTIIQKLEISAESWYDMISNIIEKEMNEKPQGLGPMGEIDFWRRRHVVLSDLNEKITSSNIQKAITILQKAKCPIYSKLNEKMNAMTKLRTESEDNAKFLSTIERHVRTLNHGSLTAMFDILPSLVDGMRMIWSISRHYNRDERMVTLMEKVACQLAIRVKESIDISEMLCHNLPQAKTLAQESHQLLESWRLTYMEVRARIEETGQGRRRWEFDRGRLFGLTDYVASICTDLIEIITTTEQFQRFLQPELTAVTGKAGTIEFVEVQVNSIKELTNNLDFDPFDPSQEEQWGRLMDIFRRKVSDIEICAGTCIEKAFQELRSSEAAFNLVENFRNIQSRPFIHRRIDERYHDILDQYSKELEEIENIFVSQKNDPPIPLFSSKLSGSISWANILYIRVKEPIVKFRSHNGLLSSGYGNIVKQRYLSLARSIDGYKEKLFRDWSSRVYSLTHDCLRQCILSKTDEDASVSPSTSTIKSKIENQHKPKGNVPVSVEVDFSLDNSGSEFNRNAKVNDVPIHSNFSREFFLIIRESRYLHQLGYEIPEPALHLCSQEENFHSYLMDLDKMTNEYNRVVSTLSDLEKELLGEQIKRMDDALKPGFNSVTWSSQLIPVFISAGNKAIETFKSTANEVQKHSSSIEEVVTRIENGNLVENFDLYVGKCDLLLISEFSEQFETAVKSNLIQLKEQYQSINPLLVKVEMVVTETDGGRAPLLFSYYKYWEHRIYHSIKNLVLRSLLSLLVILTSGNKGSPVCEIRPTVNGKDIQMNPSTVDILKHINRCARTVIDSAKSFTRWMKGTCIETEPQRNINDILGNDHTYTYYEDISVNSIVLESLLQIKYKAQNIFREIHGFTEQWRRFGDTQNLWDINIRSHMEKYVDVDLPSSFFEMQFFHYDQISQTLQESSSNSAQIQYCSLCTTKKFNMFMIDLSDVVSTMLDQAFILKNEFGDLLYTLAKQKLSLIETKTAKLQNGLLCDPETMEELKSVLSTISDVLSVNMDMELDCREVCHQYKILHKNNISIPEDETTHALSISSHWHNLVINAKTKDLQLYDIKLIFRSKTKESCLEFERKMESEKKMFIQEGPSTMSCSLDDGLKAMGAWEANLEGMKVERSSLANAESLFCLAPTIYRDLQYIESEMIELRTIYNVYRELQQMKFVHASSLWSSIDPSSMIDDVAQLEIKCRKLKIAHNIFVFKAVQDKIVALKESLPLITSLKNECIRLRHWAKISKLTETEMSKGLDGMTLSDIFAMNLEKFPNEIDEIINEATQESKIEISIKEIEEFWNEQKLGSTKYSSGTKQYIVLTSADELMLQLEDHVLNLQAMSSSRFISIFKDKVRFWEKQLNIICECLNVWFTVQRKWIYLESIFVGADDIRLQIPEEARKFDDASNIFQSLMKETYDNPIVIESCCAPSRLETFQALYSTLEMCQKSLSDYLNTKRNAFARFYFISDDELISIMGSSDPTNVQPHLLKLFENVKIFEFIRRNTKIVFIKSSEGEPLQLRSTVNVEGPVEEWMTKVDNEINNSLRFKTKEVTFKYAKQSLVEWISDELNLGMNTICSSQIWWTWFVEDSFRKVQQGEKQALREFEKILSTQLQKMVKLVRSPIDKIVRKKVNTLLIINVHARDIVASFVRESVLSSEQFEWESQLRFYWDRDEDDCIIKQCTGLFRYGYEYMGLNGRLVITPLTDRCYMTLTQALTFKLGGSPSGPAGTGKTETVKDLAKSLALPCFVINCGEGLDYLAMGATFSGLVQCGAWGCFDEFNRINIEVLSVVSAQLRAIQNALINNAPSVNIGFGPDLKVKRVKGHATSGVFITMNPGYAGRTELPDNLKALFRPVTMIVPDMLKIAENMLFSEGFEQSKTLAKKMVVLYKLSKEQLSKQYHYDFGLRSMKTVLVMAGELKRQYSDLPEDLVLMRILRDANMPKYIYEDVPLFLGLISDLFPGMECSRVGYERLKNEVTKYLNTNGYESSIPAVNNYQVDKVIQLYETQRVRHTTMLVGPTGGGKSLVLKTLANSRMKADGTVVKISMINPKAQSLNDLYGKMDETTRDWTDGVLSSIFRSLNQPLSVGRENEQRWIVFDGDVDAIWVENLNSVMDDNRLLTLPNGERIRLQSHCALICEVFDLQYASPATISRCGMIWVDPQNLGFIPFYERWLRQRYDNNYCTDESFQDESTFHMELFRKYVIPCINFSLVGSTSEEELGEKLVQVVPVTGMELCRQLCNLLDVFLPSQKDESKFNQRDIENIYIYGTIWSVGSKVNAESRKKFEAFLRQISTEILPDGCIFDSFYSLKEHQWVLWETMVKPYKQPDPFYFHQIFVPTSVSVLYHDLLERLAPTRPILFIGESGTAKTVMIENFVNSAPDLQFLKQKINLSSRTTAYDVQRCIESNLEKRLGNTYGPSGGKKLMLFVDDMHMPQVDAYGTQQPITLLLTLLDHGFVYSRDNDIFQKSIDGLQFIGAIANPVGGRNSIDTRFLARLSSFHLLNPSRKILSKIFVTILENRMKSYNESVVELLPKITGSTLNLFEFITVNLPPTPTKFHYLFNLRDLSRLFESLCYTTSDTLLNRESLIRMWKHEIQRVFFDRLVCEKDWNLIDSKLSSEINSSFPGDVDHVMKDPIIYGNFSKSIERITEGIVDPKLYEDMGSYASIRKNLNNVMESYNSNEDREPLTLVLFDMALDHVVRLIRILRNPRGNALLIGIGGSGKQSLSKLAAYTCGYDIFEISISRGYSESDFRDDIKDLYRKVFKAPIIFLFSDFHIIEEDFLEYVNNMMSVGIPPGLFDKDEREALCSEFEDLFGKSAECQVWNDFIEQCRNNLHVILSMSPSGDKLRLRCRNFPALVSSCTIDWFFAWPDEALEKVAQSFLLEDCNLKRSSLEQITGHMVNTHSNMISQAHKFKESLQRPYFVTPKNYIDYIMVFRQQLQSNLRKVNTAVTRLDSGLDKLNEAAATVDMMQNELSEKKIVVDSKTQSVERLIETIQQKTEIAKKSNENASVKQQAAEEQAAIIEKEKSKADSALMEALPAVEAAAEALNNIKREDLQELKAFNNPPIHVKIVCQMCTTMRPTGEKLDDSWSGSKKMLGNPKLLDLLKEYPKDEITEKMYKKCKKILKENKKHDLTIENMATKSKAGKGLLVWVLAILKYFEIAKDVDPLRKRVKEMQMAQAKTEIELDELNKLLDQLKRELDELQDSYSEAKVELSGLQSQASQMEKRLSAASTLMEGLRGERMRWGDDVTRLNSSKEYIIGESLLVSAFISYMGVFTAEYRHELIYDTLIESLKKNAVQISKKFRIETKLASEEVIQGWNAYGLPTDDHSVQNGILTMFGDRYPLCIDPQQQAASWIKKMFKGKQLTCKSLSDSDFLKHLELAIQFGNPFLFENVGEEIDPILNPILEKSITTVNGKKSIRIGDKLVDWDDNFRLFFCTKLSNPSYTPEVMSKVNLVNYCVTMDGLSEQLLNTVVTLERPELEVQFKDLVSNMAENMKLLVSLENALLKELSSSTGNILDNEDLVNTLNETKLKSCDIKKKIEVSLETKNEIDQARNFYRTVARRGSILYFASAGLSSINSMYEISLDTFMQQFKIAMENTTPNESLDLRIRLLIEECTMRLYNFTCTGIFERHKLTFSFNLTCMILREEGKLDESLLSFFLKGDTSLGPASKPKPSSLEWVSEKCWKDIILLSTLSQNFVPLKEQAESSILELKPWFEAENPEELNPHFETQEKMSSFEKVCLVRSFRPDRFYNAAKLLVFNELGNEFVQPPTLDYKKVYEESSAINPTIFILSPGADPQANIQNLGEDLGFRSPDKFHSVSLGQGQGPIALETFRFAYLNGHWLVLQNCHLLISFLAQLDKALETMNEVPHKDFRLWLTTEPSKSFPLGLLQKSRKVVTEPPDGIKLNIKSTLSKIDQTVIDECPHPKFAPLLFSLTFLHAVLQERRKYGKIGWNVNYDFNESDFTISRKLMSFYLTKSFDDGEESIPWKSLKFLVGDAMYGGRVSDNMDRRVLSTYLNEYFGDFMFSKTLKFYFSRDGYDFMLPKMVKNTVDEYQSHVDQFPLDVGPTVFGLHPNAEIGYLLERSKDLCITLVSLQSQAFESDGSGLREERTLSIAKDIISNIPIIKPDLGSFDPEKVRKKVLERNSTGKASPCQVVLLQEIDRWNALCVSMCKSLKSLEGAFRGEIGMSENLDEIAKALFNGYLPISWTKLAPATEKKLGSWMTHFSKRYQQYFTWIERSEPPVIWLSGLHVPQSYLSALIQTTCRRRGWPLDKSSMYTVVTKYEDASSVNLEEGNILTDGTYISGLFLEGAGWDKNLGQLRRQDPKVLNVELPLMQVVPVESSKLKLTNTYRTPVYTTGMRRNAAGMGLVFEADLSSNSHENLWSLQGVAIVLNTSD